LPDLVLIDGGKGQLNAAADKLKELGLGALPIVSLAKRDEEIFILGKSESLRLPRRSPALRMLQQARDEAHRFAITFQRKRRSVRTITSELLRIPGIGDNKRRLLLTTFGSVQAIRDATPEQIAAVPGFSLKSAARIQDSLRASDALAPGAVVAPMVPEASPAPEEPSGITEEQVPRLRSERHPSEEEPIRSERQASELTHDTTNS
jgi:excinuclease ABC subunit C